MIIIIIMHIHYNYYYNRIIIMPKNVEQNIAQRTLVFWGSLSTPNETLPFRFCEERGRLTIIR